MRCKGAAKSKDLLLSSLRSEISNLRFFLICDHLRLSAVRFFILSLYLCSSVFICGSFPFSGTSVLAASYGSNPTSALLFPPPACPKVEPAIIGQRNRSAQGGTRGVGLVAGLLAAGEIRGERAFPFTHRRWRWVRTGRGPETPSTGIHRPVLLFTAQTTPEPGGTRHRGIRLFHFRAGRQRAWESRDSFFVFAWEGRGFSEPAAAGGDPELAEGRDLPFVVCLCRAGPCLP